MNNLNSQPSLSKICDGYIFNIMKFKCILNI